MAETSAPTPLRHRVLVDDPRSERVLFDALKERARGRTELVRLTKADAVTLTGLPSEQAEPALKALVRDYRSHLAVTEEGDLVYEFDPSLERRDKVPLKERLAEAGRIAWKGFTFLFKIWIVVTLIVYVVAFVVMMLSLMVAQSSSNNNDRRRGRGFDFPWIWFWLMPDLAPQQSRYQPVRPRPRGGPQKRFYQSVFDFVFGPAQPPVDERDADRSFLAYVREHKGRITASEVVMLTGLSLAQAEEELTRLMAEYDGDVEVSDDGSLLYVFPELLVSAESTQARWRYVWDKDSSEPKLTGNSGGANAAIAGFAGFNLLASFTIAPLFLHRFGLAPDPTVNFFIQTFPLMFSSIFFAVPAARAVKRAGAEAATAQVASARQAARAGVEVPQGRARDRQHGARSGERVGQPAGGGEAGAREAAAGPRRRRAAGRRGRRALPVPAGRRGAGRGGQGAHAGAGARARQGHLFERR